MKKTILFIFTVLLLFVFLLPASASDGTPVEITLGDVYDLTSFSLILEDTNENKTKVVFSEKDDFTATLTLPAGEYTVSDCDYASDGDSQYDVNITGTTFTIPESPTPVKIKLMTGQDTGKHTLLDTLKNSKTELIVLVICGVVYFFATKKEKGKTKPVNPELSKLMEEHEAKQEFYRNDKIDYGQFTGTENANEPTTIEKDAE